MRIIGIDPGETTGWAIFSYNPNTLQGGFVASGQIGPQPHHSELLTFLQKNTIYDDDTTIVCESFQHTDERAALLTSVEYIGIVKLFVAHFRPVNLVLQTRGQKEWATNRKLIAAHKPQRVVYSPRVRHLADAQRHILYYLCHGEHGAEALRASLFAKMKR